MKIITLVFLVVVCFAVIGNLIYGLLLLETITSGTNIGISIVFTNLFILWLFPIAGLFVLLIVEKFRTGKKQN